jgi:hypothetical protein
MQLSYYYFMSLRHLCGIRTVALLYAEPEHELPGLEGKLGKFYPIFQITRCQWRGELLPVSAGYATRFFKLKDERKGGQELG